MQWTNRAERRAGMENKIETGSRDVGEGREQEDEEITEKQDRRKEEERGIEEEDRREREEFTLNLPSFGSKQTWSFFLSSMFT